MEKPRYISEIVDFFNSLEDWDPREVRGCSGDDITLLARELPHVEAVPNALKEFLLHFGKQMGGYRPEGLSLYKGIRHHNADALPEIAPGGSWRKKSDFPWPGQTIFIGEHEGYEYWFMDAAEGDDPLVYYCQVNQRPEDLRALRPFTQFALGRIQRWAEYFSEWKAKLPAHKHRLIRETISLIWDVKESVDQLPSGREDRYIAFLKDTFEGLSHLIYYTYDLDGLFGEMGKSRLFSEADCAPLVKGANLDEAQKTYLLDRIAQLNQNLEAIYSSD